MPRRASWRSRAGYLRPSVRRPADHRRRRHASALEMLEDAPDLDMIVVPIGGGGLISGVSIAARAIKPGIELIGVQAELYPSMKCAIAGCQMPLGGDTIAEGIAVKEPGELTSRSSRTADDFVLVPERDLERAVAMLVGIEKTVVEGAGAAGLAAMLADPDASGARRSRPFCAAAISTPICSPTSWSATSSARAGLRGCASRRRTARARSPRSPPILRSRRQHHRNQPQPDFHPPAGQGHDDRSRVRSARRRSRSTMSSRRSKPTVSGRSARSTDSSARTPGLLGGTVPSLASNWRGHSFLSAFQPHKEGGKHPVRSTERTFPLSAFLRDEPVALPLSRGQGRAEGLHRAQRPPCQRAQRGARPDRLPPQPVRRLSPELHRLLRLHLGPGRRRRVPAERHPAPRHPPQPRPRGHRLQALGDRGAI